MTHMLHTMLHQARLECLIKRHPCLFAAMLFVGIPLGVLLAVSFLTIAVSLPLVLLFG